MEEMLETTDVVYAVDCSFVRSNLMDAKANYLQSGKSEN